MPIPAAGSASLTTMEQHDGKYLKQVAAYYARLAAEAPPQAVREIRSIASADQGLASSLESGGGRGARGRDKQSGGLSAGREKQRGGGRGIT